jgi:hypothetical protein
LGCHLGAALQNGGIGDQRPEVAVTVCWGQGGGVGRLLAAQLCCGGPEGWGEGLATTGLGSAADPALEMGLLICSQGSF